MLCSLGFSDNYKKDILLTGLITTERSFSRGMRDECQTSFEISPHLVWGRLSCARATRVLAEICIINSRRRVIVIVLVIIVRIVITIITTMIICG